MARPFAGQVAIVTGAGSGIGRALVRALAAQGAHAVAADIDAAGAAETAALATREGRAGGTAEAATLDVTRPDDVAALVARIRGSRGRLDLMVNNAGVGVLGEVRDLPLSEWRRVIEVNLMGVVHGVHAAYPVMVAQGHGTIVNVASIMGLTPGPLLAPYTAAKHAVIGLSRALRAEARGLGVRVTCACPGFVDTPIHAASVVHGPPVGDISGGLRATTPEVVAGAILRGAARGQALVLVPGHAKVIAWLARFFPWLVDRMSAARVDKTRRLAKR